MSYLAKTSRICNECFCNVLLHTTHQQLYAGIDLFVFIRELDLVCSQPVEGDGGHQTSVVMLAGDKVAVGILKKQNICVI